MELDEHGRIFGVDEEIGEMLAGDNEKCTIRNYAC